LRSDNQGLVCARFEFNGWGEKYRLPNDEDVSRQIGKASGLESVQFPWVLEGGSIECDGEGTCLTTKQCLLNPNRNPGLKKDDIEQNLGLLGIEKTLWLSDGLLNDHTDGHIDNLARFVAPGVVVCMEARNPNDPNCAILEKIATDLSQMVDARGRKLEVIRVPSPGVITNAQGELMPASYLNFYIANTSVSVPIYGSEYDQEAVWRIRECFPGREVKGISARAILSGGGAFHCISQQQPVLQESP
jgi:agmatine deiminase